MKQLIQSPDVTYCEFPAKTYIIRQGEQVDYVYYLVSGTCYHTADTVSGGEIINTVRKPTNNIHSILGLTFIYTKERLSMGNFIAKTTCFCYKIPYQMMKHYVRNTPTIADELLHIFAGKVESYNYRYHERHEGQAANALCALLLTNSKLQDDTYIVDSTFTNAHISRILGIHKVTTAKILRALKEQWIIDKIEKQIYILEPAMLKAYAEGEKLNYRR
mgnify:CR=1 FL=1